jgi:cell division protein FtsB
MSHEEFENLAALESIGAASEEERTTLGQHLGACAACVAVARDDSEAATLMATSLEPVAPPSELREQIRNAVVPARATWWDRRKHPLWWATAATLFLALWGWSELRVRTVRSQIEELRAAGRTLEESNRRLERKNQQLTDTLSTLSASSTRSFALAGQEVAPRASARVFLDVSQRRALVFFHDLPRNPGDKNYVLWIIRADRPQPQAAGAFDVDQRGEAHLSLENVPVGVELKALAVTLESRGNASAPTGAKYLAGGSS